MSANPKQVVELVERQVRLRGNHLSKHGSLDADDIVNLLQDIRSYCQLKGIDYEECGKHANDAEVG